MVREVPYLVQQTSGPRKYPAAVQTVRAVPGSGGSQRGTRGGGHHLPATRPHTHHCHTPHTPPRVWAELQSPFFSSTLPFPDSQPVLLLLLLSLPSCCIANSIPAARFCLVRFKKKGRQFTFYLLRQSHTPRQVLSSFFLVFFLSSVPPNPAVPAVTRRCSRNTTTTPRSSLFGE